MNLSLRVAVAIFRFSSSSYGRSPKHCDSSAALMTAGLGLQILAIHLGSESREPGMLTMRLDACYVMGLDYRWNNKP